MKASPKNSKTSAKNLSNGNSHGEPSYLQKFFIDQLMDIYYAENELMKGLELLKKSTTTEELEDAFEVHLKQTEKQIKRLDKVFHLIRKKPEGKKCEAMDGLLKEARNIISETEAGTLTRDAALIIAAQKVEHYEIASYGGLAQLAITMGMNRAADLLEKTLQEEEQTDQLLTDIAESYINVSAEQEGGYEWEKEDVKSGA